MVNVATINAFVKRFPSATTLQAQMLLAWAYERRKMKDGIRTGEFECVEHLIWNYVMQTTKLYKLGDPYLARVQDRLKNRARKVINAAWDEAGRAFTTDTMSFIREHAAEQP